MNCRMTSLSTTMMQKMMRRFRTFALVLCASLFAALSAAASSAIPARPNPPRLVNDLAGIFTPMQTASLETMLVNFDDSTSNQIAVVTVNDLGGYEVADFAREIGVGWGVGSSDFNNGIVVLVKPKTEGNGGEVTIQVGYGLEGAIPDAECWAIIRDIMIPSFKEGDYFNGVNNACLRLMGLASGEIKASRNGRDPDEVAILTVLAFLFVFFFYLILKYRNKNNSGGSGSSGGNRKVYVGPIFGGGFQDSGSSWGGGFNGGFGGFGGGSFGGGGASGSW